LPSRWRNIKKLTRKEENSKEELYHGSFNLWLRHGQAHRQDDWSIDFLETLSIVGSMETREGWDKLSRVKLEGMCL
jgi:hypothetical protein